MEEIQAGLMESFKGRLLLNEIENADSGDQFCFLKALIQKEGIIVKIEIIQNVPLLDPFEIVDNIKRITIRDIALLKLSSICSRKALKDLYDLDLITDKYFTLAELLDMLAEKENKFNGPEYKWLFDLDEPVSPVNNVNLLLEVDNINYKSLPSRPNHSNDLLAILSPYKDLATARRSWRRKVRDLMRSRNIEMPPVKPVN
ncbi:MAG: hypothetical protein J7497_16390 [Chitinophagaceae bacterium]|nr:hypothetical protein [Chitinophagaceae bacterium]